MSAPQRWTLQAVAPATTRGWGDHKREVPEVRGKVEVSLDWHEVIEYMAVRALRSKGGKCRSGPVTVKRVRK